MKIFFIFHVAVKRFRDCVRPRADSVSRWQMGPSAFDVLKYVDQGKVFGRVHTALAHGKCLGVSTLSLVLRVLCSVFDLESRCLYCNC